MTSASLTLQDVLGDAIVTQLAADSITAEVVTNPTQGGAYPFVVIGEDAENTIDTQRDQIKTSLAHDIFAHSDSNVEARQVRNSIVAAVGPGAAKLNLGANHYEVSKEIEAADIAREIRPEGDIYNVLVRVRYLISHT